MSRYDDNEQDKNNYKDQEVTRKRKGRVDNVTKRRVKTQFFIEVVVDCNWPRR